ncbi:hypothetical protein NZNM25_18640 [Nitrosopumilus zosterae]|uniref:ArnR1-like winged helix-turn-helix domain-containing protein n=1 Tax=Nitrosopumilus zosterae TaxID=718286 RepID=A0A2S2KTV6_9ARCH|nr:hypothetical protein [Nitrosopumilus zosterae]BDQ31726.1 hypothetical protein NZOSNM25_001860 [Nitrosopumilus zosterae]GBH35073.1 hypothetical protein NZNM25_18640 [Nitrosopumilus zosterae]
MDQKINSNIKEMDIINWSVVERIMLAFYENGSLKKSQITSKSGLKYTSCMRYLKWLHTKMGFVEFELGVDLKHASSIHLSAEGILFCKKRILASEDLNSVKIQQTHLLA